MPDFFARRDLSTVSSFDNEDALFEFSFEADEQSVINESAFTLAVSFDGVNVHQRLSPSGPTQIIEWDNHLRRKMYVRRESGAGGAEGFASVSATTR